MDNIMSEKLSASSYYTKFKKDTSISEKLFTGFVYLFIILFTLACFLPFWLVLINSFASEASLQANGYQLIPSEFSFNAYQFIFKGQQIFRSYGITIFVTVVGTFLAVILTSSYAYMLAHPKNKYGNILSFMTYFTMIFGSGLVGFYLLISKWLGLGDTIWALIVPYLLNPFYAFILVSYYRSIPYELNEAATIDGASEFKIFYKIIWPVSKPVIATISLFYSLLFWNDWWLALLFINDDKLHPLQMMLRRLISNINMAQYVAGSNTSFNMILPAKGVQLALVCLTIGPIVFAYPYIQKYFVKGITIGAVKG